MREVSPQHMQKRHGGGRAAINVASVGRSEKTFGGHAIRITIPRSTPTDGGDRLSHIWRRVLERRQMAYNVQIPPLARGWDIVFPAGRQQGPRTVEVPD